MRIDVQKYLPRFRPCGRTGGWSTFALIFVLSAFALVARAQTVGPITPNPSQAPQQASPRTATQAPRENAKGSLAGMWKLNRGESDDPDQKLEQASSGGRGGWGQGPTGGGGWGGWGGGGGWCGAGSGRGGGWNRPGGRSSPEEGAVDMSDFSQLTIEQSDSSAKVTGATGRILAVYSSDNGNDKDAAKKSKDGPYVPPVAKRQGDGLVTTVNGPRGTKTTRVYELSSDGRQLYVTTRLENPRWNQPVNIRFVYDQSRSSGN
jgi:hypothetical protein